MPNCLLLLDIKQDAKSGWWITVGTRPVLSHQFWQVGREVPTQSSLSYIIYMQIFVYHTWYIYVPIYIYRHTHVYGFIRCGIQSCMADRLAGRPNALSNWQRHDTRDWQWPISNSNPQFFRHIAALQQTCTDGWCLLQVLSSTIICHLVTVL